MIIKKRDLHSIITKASIQNHDAKLEVENKRFGDLIRADWEHMGLDTLGIDNALSDYKWLREKEKQIEEIKQFLETVDNEYDIEIRMFKKEVASLMRGEKND